MRSMDVSRLKGLIICAILFSSELAAGGSGPDLTHLHLPDSYDIHPQIYFCVNYVNGQKFWAVHVERLDYELSNDEMIFHYEIYRYIENWVVLDINSQLVCDGSVCRDIALAADGAFRIFSNQDTPLEQGWVPLYMWGPEALNAKADEWRLIADLADWMEIFQAVGDISAGTVTALLLGPASELQKLTVREALKVTAKNLLKEANDYYKAGWTVENAYKQTLKNRARNAADSLRVYAAKDIRIELGSCVEFSEMIDFRDGVSDIQARGEGTCRGLYEFYKGGLAQYLISVIEEAVPFEFLKRIDEIVDAIAGNPDLAAAIDMVAYREAIALKEREGTLHGSLEVMKAFCNANREQGLLAYWKFDEGSSSIASDSSGNGNDGTIYGATWTIGKIGNALSFDGFDDWVDIPDSISPEHITLATWIYPTGFDARPNQVNPIITKETGRGTPPWWESFAWRIYTTPDAHLQFQVFTNTGGAGARSTTVLQTNTWYHVAGTYDGTTAKLYVNEILEDGNISSSPGSLVTTSLPTAIGHLEGWSVQWFEGIIDEARIYDRALSDSEIKALVSGLDDTDADGIPDDIENATGTEPFDDDTDNDGLLDGPGSGEDANANGVVDPGETDPRSVDTDTDGIQDGTECGLVAPEGLDTILRVFVPDVDPSNTTDPTNPDSDGDGLSDGEEDLDRNGKADFGESNPNVITGALNFEPDTLNLKSKGRWVTCYFELSEGYNVTDINLSSIRLNDTISPDHSVYNFGDYNENRITDLMVKFNREQLIGAIGPVRDRQDIVLTLTGQLSNGTKFEGIDTIRVINKGE